MEKSRGESQIRDTKPGYLAVQRSPGELGYYSNQRSFICASSTVCWGHGRCKAGTKRGAIMVLN